MNPQHYIESVSTKVNESLRGLFIEMNTHYIAKHWYELGETIMTVLREEKFYRENISLIEFYTNYIASFETKLLENTLADIAYLISDSIHDPGEALAFLDGISGKLAKNKDAKQKCLISQGFVYSRTGSLEKVKEIVDKVGDELDIFGDLTQLHGIYFKLGAEYHRKMGNHTKHYHMQLNFMSCAPPNILFGGKFLQSVVEISRSAILSPDIINLQEWLKHKAVESLVGTEFEWMKNMMECISNGDLKMLKLIRPKCQEYDEEFANNFEVIQQKISLNALVMMRFLEHSRKYFSFEEISTATGVEVSEVEYLVMKALAKNVIRGHIDQVMERVYIEWTYPRICTKEEIMKMKDKIYGWAEYLNNFATRLEMAGSPILQRF